MKEWERNYQTENNIEFQHHCGVITFIVYQYSLDFEGGKIRWGSSIEIPGLKKFMPPEWKFYKSKTSAIKQCKEVCDAMKSGEKIA